MGRNRLSAGRGPGGTSYKRFTSWEAAKWGLEFDNAAGWTPTADEQTAIAYYTGPGSYHINRYLRGIEAEQPAQEKKRSDALAAALARAKIPENVEGLRYFRDFPNTLAMAKAGDVFLDNGFTSTSLRQDWTWGASSGAHRAIIQIPRGSRGAAVERYSSNPTEREVILQRGTRFRVVHIGKGTLDDPTILRVLKG